MAQEWETVESSWGEHREKFGVAQKPGKPLEGTLADQLATVEHWLRHAQSQLAHGADAAAIANLTQEARQQKENLRRLQAQAQAQKADPLVVRARELTNGIDSLLKKLEERSQLGNRIQAFLQAADGVSYLYRLVPRDKDCLQRTFGRDRLGHSVGGDQNKSH